jgi:hypothetical protein
MKKTTLIILTIFLTLTLTSFLTSSNRLYVSGTILSSDKDPYADSGSLNIFVKADNKVIASANVDKDGKYNINFIVENQTSFDFYVTGFGIDTILIKSFTKFDSDNITFDIRFPITYKKSTGQVICPKCNKSTKVYKIIYGDAPKYKTTIVKGDTVYSPIVNNKYYAGTCIKSLISPEWYCDRDKVAF